MKIHKDINNLPDFTNAVLTIGSFDGVHEGHLKILGQVCRKADEIDGDSVVITFYPHPKMVIGNDDFKIQLLNTMEEKISLLENAGIDHLVIVPFSSEFAEMDARSYITEFLVKNFKPHTLIIGYDHRFGKNRTGDIGLLQSMKQEFHFEIMEIPEQIIKDITVSSTKIRQHLMSGEIETANELLGYPYPLSGTVEEGEKMGRKIGFPTANVAPDQSSKLIPGDGVYMVWVQLEYSQKKYKGMLNIGHRPTFGSYKRSIEVHILDFSDDIYEKRVTISFIKKIRNEIKFESAEALKEQLDKDLILTEKSLITSE
jgi:riboflavin kinase/FMN adenylyltransferase